MGKVYDYVQVEAVAANDTIFTAKQLANGQETGVFITECTINLQNENIRINIEDLKRRKAGDTLTVYYCKEINKYSVTNPNIKKEKKHFGLFELILGIAVVWIVAVIILVIKKPDANEFKVFITVSFQFILSVFAISLVGGIVHERKISKSGKLVNGVITGYIGERYDGSDRPSDVNRNTLKLIPVKKFTSNEEMISFIRCEQHQKIIVGNEIVYFRPVVSYEWNGIKKEIHLTDRYSYRLLIKKNNFINTFPIGSTKTLVIDSNGEVVAKTKKWWKILVALMLIALVVLMTFIYIH